jgi:hypothetical protein
MLIRHPDSARGNDLYETLEVATLSLLAVEPLPPTILEPACGRGAIGKVLRSAGHTVIENDIVDYRQGQDSVQDFLNFELAQAGEISSPRAAMRTAAARKQEQKNRRRNPPSEPRNILMGINHFPTALSRSSRSTPRRPPPKAAAATGQYRDDPARCHAHASGDPASILGAIVGCLPTLSEITSKKGGNV